MAVNSVDVLRQARPEWVPWLAVVDESLREIGGAHWQAALPESPQARDSAPLLDGAAFALDGAPVRRLLDRLLHRASRCGTPTMAPLDELRRGALDHGSLLRASIVQDSRAIAAVAQEHGIDADALHAVLALLCIPVLQHCRGQWSASLSPGWSAGHCPVCASWPAFAEIRGIDRHRYLRCARCGAGWHGEVLRCAFCGNADHGQLTTLVPGQQGVRGVIEACRRCRSYIKVFTTLQGTPPAAVILEDLASVELDIAAVEQGFARPAGAACAFDVSVALTPAGRQPFAWNS